MGKLKETAGKVQKRESRDVYLTVYLEMRKN